MTVKLPLAPIEAEILRRETTPTAFFGGIGSPMLRRWHKAKARGYLTVDFADLIATRVLGVHPVCVFGDLIATRVLGVHPVCVFGDAFWEDVL